MRDNEIDSSLRAFDLAAERAVRELNEIHGPSGRASRRRDSNGGMNVRRWIHAFNSAR